ncbi:hypothetical protein [Streptomyces clavuligerus]|uniref:hypothetical protein n=1 Tax=Streptomyces clavuligerus TaxID=1901 RepID=UPI001E4EF0C2|nr:hypothetical protein [Streptomyces clavuligerus]
MPPEDPGHARLQDAAAHAAYLLGLPDAVTRARELYDRAADPARRSRLGFLTALALLQDGRPAQAHPLVDEALAVHALPGRPARTARFLALRAALLCGGRRLDEARTLADQALERSLAVRAPVAEAYARSVRAQLLTHAGDHPAALRESVRARTAARRRAETRDIQLVQTLLGAHLLGCTTATARPAPCWRRPGRSPTAPVRPPGRHGRTPSPRASTTAPGTGTRPSTTSTSDARCPPPGSPPRRTGSTP